MRAAGARKIRKSVTRREKSGAGSGTRLLVHSSAMWPPRGTRARSPPSGWASGCAREGSRSAMECHACCAGGSHAVCAGVHARVRDRECDGHACASVRRALARPKRNLVKVAPGYLRKRVKVASQRDRHKMVKVSEGAENIPPPYAVSVKSHKTKSKYKDQRQSTVY